MVNIIREKDKEIFRLNSIITDIKSIINYWYDKDGRYIDVVNDIMF